MNRIEMIAKKLKAQALYVTKQCAAKNTNLCHAKDVTDQMQIAALNLWKLTDKIGELSDGYHTFDELYEHRHALFCMLVNQNPDKSWKSRNHDDGSTLDGWFIAGLSIPHEGMITYHVPDKYWKRFNCRELAVAPPWDGHTSKDVINRLWQGRTTFAPPEPNPITPNIRGSA